MPLIDIEGHQIALAGGEALKRINETQRRLFPDWLLVADALAVCRDEALRVSGSDQPKGRAYNKAMSALLREYELSDIDKDIRADLFKIRDKQKAVQEWLSRQDHPERLNHPRVVWEKFQRSSKQQDERDANREIGQRGARDDRIRAAPLSALAKARAEAAQLRARVQELEEELEAARERIRELEAAKLPKALEAA